MVAWLVLTLVLLAVFLLWYLQFFWSHRRILSTASKLPCPPTTPLLGNALLFAGGITRVTQNLIKFTTEFQGLFCLWVGPLPVFVVSDPMDVQTVLNSSSTLEKDDIYKFLNPFLGNGLLTAPVRVWKRYRRLIIRVLHPANVEMFLPDFNEISRRVSNELGSGKPTDPREQLFNAAVDAVMGTVMARRSVDLTTKRNIHLLLDRVGQMFTYRLFKVWLHIDFIFNTLYRSELKLVFESISACLNVFKAEWADEEVLRNAKTDKEETENTDRLSLIDVAWDQRLENATDHEWSDEVFTMIAGATDTVVAAMSFLLISLANHSEAQAKIRAEIREVIGDSSRDVTFAELEAMPYLGCALLETMRLHGIFPVILRRATKDTKLSNNCTLPAGSRILVDLYSMGWDPARFPEPDKFLPERFQDITDTNRSAYTFLPFSGGPRSCPGKSYAMLFMKTLAVHVLRKYQLTSPVQLKDIEYELKVVMISKTPLPILFEPIMETF